MTETNFCDGLEPCEVNGHVIVLKQPRKQISQHFHEKIEECEVCGMKIRTTKYKWMPERIEYFDSNGVEIDIEDE